VHPPARGAVAYGFDAGHKGARYRPAPDHPGHT
jgi:hypothetical protein